MKIKKHFFTLLETLIAVAWIVILLSVLSFSYQQMVTLNNKGEAIQNNTFHQRYLENRLSMIFPRTFNEEDNQKDFYFFTYTEIGGLFKQGSSKSLIFTYDNNVDIDKQLSNHVVGLLYLDPQGRLSLATWPSPKRWVQGVNPRMKKEVLLDDVDSFSMSFFIPPEKKWEIAPPPDITTGPIKKTKANTSTTPAIKPGPEGGWVEEWLSDYKLLPGMIRLEVKRKGTTEYFVFPLSMTSRQIVYNQ